jgi:hypothetical protein
MSNIAGQVNLTYQLDVFSKKNCLLFGKNNVEYILAPPTIDRSNLVEIYQVKFNRTARLECPMDGKPKPHIMWLINGRDLNTNNGKFTKEFQKKNISFFLLISRSI